jgi:hypothetical protein
MKRSRTWLLVALTLVVALLSAGCFQIRAFFIEPKSLAAGEVAQVKLSLFPLSTNAFDTQVGRVVLLVGIDDIEFAYASNFDLTGNWGGPVGQTTGGALRTLMRSGGVCSARGVDASAVTGFTWRAILSTADIGADPPTAAQLDDVLRVNLGFRAPAGVGDGGLITADGPGSRGGRNTSSWRWPAPA